MSIKQNIFAFGLQELGQDLPINKKHIGLAFLSNSRWSMLYRSMCTKAGAESVDLSYITMLIYSWDNFHIHGKLPSFML